MNRALFLDRDGVINEDYGYVHKIDDFHFCDGIFDVSRAAIKANMKIIVVTNQAGIGRGIYSKNDFLAVTKFMKEVFASNKAPILDVYFCPFHPTGGLGPFKKPSYDRKPNPGMLLRASCQHNINLFHSLMIGDTDTDLQAASMSGIRWYVDSNNPDWVARAISLIRTDYSNPRSTLYPRSLTKKDIPILTSGSGPPHLD
jgi:D-glycero-D-manno-heptose 1,7-bisphosphate phosphatase